MVDTDALLAPYCDISGTCLLSSEKALYGKYTRPRLTKKLCNLIGTTWGYDTRGLSIIRWIWWNIYPETDKGYCLTLKCGNQNCVRASHIQLGVLNPPMITKKYI